MDEKGGRKTSNIDFTGTKIIYFHYTWGTAVFLYSKEEYRP